MGKPQDIVLNAIKPINIKCYVEGIVNDFGLKFTLLCISNYFGIKGALGNFLDSVQTPYWKEGGWNNLDYSSASATAKIPLSIKGFGGLLTDLIPIFGYEKTSYMYIYTIIGTVSCITLAIFTMTKETINITIPTLLFLFINLQVSFTDLLIEGKYADLMKLNPNNKGNVISFTYFCVTLGQIIPAITVGLMSDGNIPVKTQFFVYIPFTAQGLIFLFFGCMIDDEAQPSRNNRIDFSKLNTQRHISFMAFVMVLAGIGTIIVNIFSDTTTNLVYNLSAGSVLGLIAWFTLPKIIAKVIYYIYLVNFTYINLEAHLEYFYTLTCVENGPHFQFVYYKTYVGSAQIIANFIGIWLFQAILCQYKFRLIFWTSTIIRCFGSIFDIIIINRWNLLIGINDHTMYLVGSAILYSICYQLDYMPTALICAKVCPKAVETIMFSITAGYGNYGQVASSFLGNYIIKRINVVLQEGGTCRINNLAWVVFSGHCIMPLLTIPFTFMLIPDKFVNDNFADSSFKSFRYYNYEDDINKNGDESQVFLSC